MARYCSEKCQYLDWRKHKKQCAEWKKWQAASKNLVHPLSRWELQKEFPDDTPGSLITVAPNEQSLQGAFRFVKWTKDHTLARFDRENCCTWSRQQLVQHYRDNSEVYHSILNVLFENQGLIIPGTARQLLYNIERRRLVMVQHLCESMQMKVLIQYQPSNQLRAQTIEQTQVAGVLSEMGMPIVLEGVKEAWTLRTKRKCLSVIAVLILPIKMNLSVSSMQGVVRA